jgi:predicted component of type VI protein secretion system
VTAGLHVQITNDGDGTSAVRSFPQRTVRIGCSSLNDLHLDDSRVSPFHAVVVLQDERVFLRDLGSDDGTRLASGRAVPHVPIELTHEASRFSIANFSFDVRVGVVAPHHKKTEENATPKAPSVAKPSGAERSPLLEPTAVVKRKSIFDTSITTGHLRGDDDEPDERTVITSPEAVRQILEDASNPAERTARERELADFTLACVRELAASYLPGQRLRTSEDVARFVTRVRDVLDLFIGAFVSLRQVAGERLDASVAIPASANQMAAWLLDATSDMATARRAIDGMLADLVIQNLSFLDSMMRGVRVLLSELAPNAADAELEARARVGEGGFRWGPWRFQKLWALYSARYARINESDPHSFTAFFGSAAAAAHARLNGADERNVRTIRSASD